MSSIPANLQAVYARITRAAGEHGRAADSVTLLAVSKTFDAATVAACADAGQGAFGENYVQEALGKIAALQTRRLEWHFIGPIQSNKTRAIAEHFDWVHGIERDKIARRLSEARPAALPPLNVCVQVNVSGEASKSGVAPDESATAPLGAQPTFTPMPTTTNFSCGTPTASSPPSFRSPITRSFGHLTATPTSPSRCPRA